MPPEKDGHKWLHLVLGTIGAFVLLNEAFGTGTLEGLLHVSWGRVLPWVFLVLGLSVSAFLVEAYRRRRRGGNRWFIEVYFVIGGVYVFDTVTEEFLSPLASPFTEWLFAPLREMGVWGVVVLSLAALVGLALVLRKLWRGYWEMEPPAQQN